jgi:hypothetical protein
MVSLSPETSNRHGEFMGNRARKPSRVKKHELVLRTVFGKESNVTGLCADQVLAGVEYRYCAGHKVPVSQNGTRALQ